MFQSLIAVKQRISPGNKHIAYLLMLPDIICRFLKIIRRLLLADTYKALPEAVPAVHGAPVSGQDQGGFPVFMLQARKSGVFRFPAGIKLPRHVVFFQRGDAHTPDGILRIVPINQ